MTTTLAVRLKRERAHVEEGQLRERQAVKHAYLAEVRRIKEARAAARPTGLAAFLGRVTGVSLVIQKIHQHRDALRFAAYSGARPDLKARQGRVVAELTGRILSGSGEGRGGPYTRMRIAEYGRQVAWGAPCRSGL